MRTIAVTNSANIVALLANLLVVIGVRAQAV